MSKDKADSSFLSPESIRLFTAGLLGLSEEEIRKTKELFIRNAISEYHAEIKSRKNNYFTMGLHLLIPIFWPMLFGGQREAKIELEEKRNKILNALEVWKDDLSHCYGDLKAKLDSDSTK